MMLLLLQVLLIAISLLPTFCTTEEFFVSPTSPPNPACPSGKPCHTLNEYAQNGKILFGLYENIHLFFLDGTHEMSIGLNLKLFRRHQVVLAGLSAYSNSSVTVRSMSAQFVNNQMIKFEAINFFMGSMLTFGGCSVAFSQVVYEQYRLDSSQGLNVLKIHNSLFIGSTYSLSNDNSFGFGRFYYCRMHQNSSNFEMSNSVMSGALINFYLIPTTVSKSITTRMYNIIITKGRINIIAATIFKRTPLLDMSTVSFEIINCSVTQGSMNVHFGGRHGSDGTNQTVVMPVILLLQNVSFTATTMKESVLDLHGPMKATIDSCSFSNNNVLLSTINLDTVDLCLVGNSSFSTNIATNGGAIYMSRSIIWLEKGAHVSFVNNRASQVGGAITVEEKFANCHSCFYDLNFTGFQEGDASLIFSNNSAEIGGDNIFGAALRENCKTTCCSSLKLLLYPLFLQALSEFASVMMMEYLNVITLITSSTILQ